MALVVVVGPRKTATSWLHALLSQDERVAVPTLRKELSFFDAHYDRGVNWYERQFPVGAATQARLDCSPTYFADPRVPERIAALHQDPVLVAILRDPAERTVSDYFHALRRGDLPAGTGLTAACDALPSLVTESDYAEHLARWAAQPGLGGLHVLFYDQLASDPDAFYTTFMRVAGLEPLALDPSAFEVVFGRTESRFPRVMSVVMPIVRFLHRRNLSRLLAPLGRLRGALERPSADGSVDPDELAALRARLEPDRAELARALASLPNVVCHGPLPEWLSPGL